MVLLADGLNFLGIELQGRVIYLSSVLTHI